MYKRSDFTKSAYKTAEIMEILKDDSLSTKEILELIKKDDTENDYF